MNGVFNILTPRQRKAIQAMVEIGSNPGNDRSAAEMAGLLGLSRESVHQLLAPYVRAGLLVAARGRTGGYRAGADLPGTPLAAILAPYAGLAPRPARAGRAGLDRLVDALEAEAAGARLAVYQRLTLGELVRRLRAEREALDWEI
ncbi:MAG: Rrf2 family transcriptional regulator [Holophagales bacterium]|nr:Rrf2 family transcriptional regulator [Holophagales bacterium]